MLSWTFYAALKGVLSGSVVDAKNTHCSVPQGWWIWSYNVPQGAVFSPPHVILILMYASVFIHPSIHPIYLISYSFLPPFKVEGRTSILKPLLNNKPFWRTTNGLKAPTLFSAIVNFLPICTCAMADPATRGNYPCKYAGCYFVENVHRSWSFSGNVHSEEFSCLLWCSNFTCNPS